VCIPNATTGTVGPVSGGYKPMMTAARAARLRAWHEAAYQEGRGRTRTETVTYLEREFLVPPTVHPLTPMSDVLGRCVLEEVRETDRVLDLGTGTGVNAILAASRSADVLAVDINPDAVDIARRNAERNGVAGRVEVRESDLFERVDGGFDLIIFDPPFRWFAPRDMLERSMADENYATLTAFFDQVPGYLTDAGRILLFFGSSGDIEYLKLLSDRAGLHRTVLRTRDLVRDDLTVTYYTFRLTIGAPDSAGILRQ
jgi:release factor glutamine methyltransferase